MKNILIKFLFLFLYGILLLALAASHRATGLGGVAVNMMEPVSLMSDFVHTACVIIGASFLFASIIKYVEHRRSPLMVPISTVVFLVIAGLALIFLPFLGYLTQAGIPYSLMK